MNSSISDYDYDYTDVQQDTWRRFFHEIEGSWARHAALLHPYYRDNLPLLLRFRDHIPSLAEINELLKPIGWSSTYVDGFAQPWKIARSIDQHILPISRAIRPPNEIFFGNEPDFIHDIFGHLPLLFSHEYRNILSSWSYAAARLKVHEIDKANYHLNKSIAQNQDKVSVETLAHLKASVVSMDQYIAQQPTPTYIFDKVYFWVFEFGLVQVQGELKVLGAGLLSSLSEMDKIAAGGFATRSLDAASVLSPYHISTQQDAYLVASDLRQFRSVIDGAVLMHGVSQTQREVLYA